MTTLVRNPTYKVPMIKFKDEKYWKVDYPPVCGDLEDLVWVNQDLAKECLKVAQGSFPTDVLDAAQWATDCSGLSHPLASPSPPTHEGERSLMLYHLLFLYDLSDAYSAR